MNWIGKIIGLVLGYMAGGILGALVGLALGHWFDKGLARTRFAAGGGGGDPRAAFFRTTFTVMGHLCKADGRVSQAEIAAAEQVMARMRLTAEQRRQAIEYFNQGKSADFDLDAALDEFRRTCHGRINLVRIFLEIQIQAAMADGALGDAEREVLRRIAAHFGVSEADFERLVAFLSGGYGRSHASEAGRDPLPEAYRELGVSPDASDAEIKRAYRKLMSEHHPDKLVSKGLPEEMIDVAKERTQEIQAAYDTIRRARGLK
ncbi:co-chaperone DjlA [Arhodomonas sp. AD133]|uniref:co-chaperone DjlA n=1 Tax=Arhodomonas sp. AD133 TaxID=3415009 RepID=UPI003EBCE248